MQQIKQIYRSGYTGESVVTNMTWTNRNWEISREFVPSNVINNQTSNQAVILGNGPSRLQLDRNLLGLLANHRGGPTGQYKLQTYGCNALYKDFSPDFLIATGTAMTAQIAGSGYCATHVVYANSSAVLDYPGNFYLIPQDPAWDAGSLAAYMACFDGHNKVYLIGFDGDSGQSDSNYNVYINQPGYPTTTDPSTEGFTSKAMLQVMNTYADVEFIRVMPATTWYIPDAWKYQTNLSQIDFRTFVGQVDL
jgi:hypothetical protein